MKKFAACSGLFLALTTVVSCVAGEDLAEEELTGADEEELLAATEQEVAASGDISVKASGTFTFSKTDTNSAQQNTVNRTVTLAVGQQLTAGTCDIAGASVVDDSYLRIYGPNGLEVASNDDACGGRGSKIVYTATTAGVYTMRIGCYAATACSGTVAWNNNGGSPGPGPGGSYSYSANNTNSAQQNTDNRVISANLGQRVTVSICVYSGDPYLRITGPGGYLIGSNDDGCGVNGSKYSFVTTSSGSYTIHAGCYASGSCTGQVVWSVENVQ